MVMLDDDRTATVEQMRGFVERTPTLRREARFALEGPIAFKDVEARLAS